MTTKLVPALATLAALVVASGDLHAAPPAGKAVCLDAYENGQVLLRRGQLLAARDKLAVCAQDPCPALLQPECAQWLEEARRRLPSLVVVLRTAGGQDVPNASLAIDGVAIGPRLEGGAIEVDPGPHVLRVETTQNGKPWSSEQRLVASEGEKSRLVPFVLPDPGPSAPAVTSSAPREEPQAGGHHVDLPTWLSIGVAGLGLATFGTFAVLGENEYSGLKECEGNCARDDVDRAQTYYTVADVGLVTAVLAAGLATFFYFRSGPSTPAASHFARTPSRALSTWK